MQAMDLRQVATLMAESQKATDNLGTIRRKYFSIRVMMPKTTFPNFRLATTHMALLNR